MEGLAGLLSPVSRHAGFQSSAAQKSEGDRIACETLKKLQKARNDAGRVRLCVSGFMLAGGASFFIASLVILALAGIDGFSLDAVALLYASFGHISCLLTLLALLPTDAKLIRYAAAFVAVVYTVSAARTVCLANELCQVEFLVANHPGNTFPDNERAETDPIIVAWLSVHASAELLTALGVIPAILARRVVPCWPLRRSLQAEASRGQTFKFGEPLSSRASLQSIWLALTTGLFIIGTVELTALVALWIVDNDFPGSPVFAFLTVMGILDLLLASVFLYDKVRGHVHEYLCSLVLEREAQQAAAVAALIGGIDASQALTLARRCFRALPFDELREADLLSNSDTGLHSRTVAVQLGECDVFLSHSWRDNAAAKFAALRTWCTEFEHVHGRPPLVWLDKACIDQSNIEKDLACLPIFLAGCKHLLIVAGPTYTTRLWCAVEVFTFMQMGGSFDRVTVAPIVIIDNSARSSAAIAARKDLKRVLSDFDANHAQCYHESDRDRLLATIETSFGSLDNFNHAVRTVFVDRERESLARAHRRRASGRKASILVRRASQLLKTFQLARASSQRPVPSRETYDTAETFKSAESGKTRAEDSRAVATSSRAVSRGMSLSTIAIEACQADHEQQ
uniref:TIR domain-containing protein n=1 Tax=Chrysotila carterae TaxID=13221 RepID=A0A7S4EW07_CHRCT